MCSGITRGRVLSSAQLSAQLCTKISEAMLSAFMYRLFRADFSSTVKTNLVPDLDKSMPLNSVTLYIHIIIQFQAEQHTWKQRAMLNHSSLQCLSWVSTNLSDTKAIFQKQD